MKIRSVTGAILHLMTGVSAVLALLAGGVAYAQTGAAGPMAVELDISTRAEQPLNPLVYGFNTNLSKVPWRYDSRDYTRAVANLQPAALRFPGGTTANFYHWNPRPGERNSFYQNEIDAISDPKLKNSIQAARQALQRNSPADPTLNFADFMALCKANGIKPVIVVNVHTGTPEEAAAWVKYTVDHNFEVAYWELGNELYMKRYWYPARGRNVFRTVSRDPRNVTANATALMEDVLPAFVQAMRAASPVPIKISVPAAPFDTLESKPDNARWDRVLARQRYDYYDAYTVHSYTGVMYDGTPFPNTDNARYRFEDYANWFFNDNARKLDTLLAHYRQRYGRQRDMIITEWNYFGFAHPKYNRSAINMTHLGALYVGDRVVSLLQRGEEVALAMYHNLGSAGRWPSPVARDRDTGAARRNPWFYPLYLVGQALEGTSRLLGAEVRNAPRISGRTTWNQGTPYRLVDAYDYPAVNAVAMGGARGQVAVLASNRSAQAGRLALVLDGAAVSGPVQGQCFANPDLGAQTAASLQTRSLAQDLRQNLQAQTSTNGAVALPAYAFCLFTFGP